MYGIPPVLAEAYSGFSQASEMELFAKIVIGLKPLAIFAKSPSEMFCWVPNKRLIKFEIKPEATVHRYSTEYL